MAEKADVLVVGSGAAGLTAALTAAVGGATVVVLEASDRFGGSTAVSGGQVWAPNLQADDSLTDALTYCQAAAPGRDPELVETFVRSVPLAVRFIEANTAIRFAPMPSFPDTFSELPCGKPARHVEPEPLPASGLTNLLWPGPFGPAVLTNEEIHQHGLFHGGIPPMDLIGRRTAAAEVTMGTALIVGLLRGCQAAGVELIRSCRVQGLVRSSAWAVDTDRGRMHADRVVLATGGFEHSKTLRSELLGGPLTHPATPPIQHGDGLRLAAQVGARLSRTNEYWSWPTFQVPGRAWPDGTPQPQLVMGERNLPHVIWVNAAGHRFVNESSHNCAAAFAELDPTTHQPRNLPAWAVGDAQFRARYPVAGVLPGQPAPDWLPTADTLEALAKLVGINAPELANTVTDFNAGCNNFYGDPFHRGQSRYENTFGDPTAPHPNLGPVSEPPFFALPIHPGAVGTKGGPQHDHRARVLDWAGEPIPGLYVAGNAAAAVVGPGTIAGGLTIASALTWGWIAGGD